MGKRPVLEPIAPRSPAARMGGYSRLSALVLAFCISRQAGYPAWGFYLVVYVVVMEWRIKIHRGIDRWWRRHDLPTLSLFLYCLTHANIEERERMWQKVGVGELVVGRKKLAQELKMSEQSIRTAISHLISTNEITIRVTNRFSIITVVWWEKYQSRDLEVTNKSTSKLTNNQPTANQQLTTLKEDKEEKEGKNARARETSSPQTPGGLERFNQVAENMKPALLELWPACTDSQFAKTVVKCYERATRGWGTITWPEQLLRSWFVKQVEFMSGYESWLVAPQTEEQWVQEYGKLGSIPFTDKYGADRAREVRDRRFNKEMFGVYTLNK